MKKNLLALLIACSATSAFADIWINPGFYSHYTERNKDLKSLNTGLGIEISLTDNYSATAGFFENADRTTSHYVGFYAMPFKIGGFKAGTVVGAFDGFPHMRNGKWFPAVLPTVAFEGRQVGLNVGFIPTVGDRIHGAMTFQLKYNLRP